MKLFATRHGETTWNREGRILGHTPGELTGKGKDQALAVSDRVRGAGFTAVYCSDLKRCVEMAEVIKSHHPELKIHFTEKLRERNFGELEGQKFEDVDWDGFWSSPPDESQHGAESLDDFTQRIAGFMLSIEKEDTVLLLSHSGVMNRLNYLQDPENFEVVSYSNADVTKFDADKILENSRRVLEQSPAS